MTENQHIREFLNYYCTLPKAPQYAVLLVGLWGSGKTWFIKDFVANHLTQSDRVLYLSLYGVQSFDDIESEFFRLLHPVLGSKPARVLHRLARGVLKTSLNFDIDGDGKSDGSISGGLPTEKVLERISLDSTKILVLDDLERCSIPVSDLLGYVNQFIEHGGIKAVLIANEMEILNAASGAGAGYARIKEKLIGRTFEVIPEVGSALEHFAADLPSMRAQQVVRSNFPLITQVYECSKYKNLRLVRNALWDFDRLLQSLETSVLESDELLKDLLALFLAYSFEVHSGAVKPSELEKLQDPWSHLRQNKDKPDPVQRFREIGAKYSGLNLYTSLVQQSVWVAIFSTGSVPRVELNESLQKSKYFQDNDQPNWVKLWYGTNLSDSDFASVLATVDEEWSSRLYRNLGEVVHVTGLLIRYAKHGIYSRSVEDVVASAKEYVNDLLASGDVPMMKPNTRWHFERESYAGLGFTSKEEQAFQDFFEYIEERQGIALEASFPAQATALLSLIDTDTNLFYRRLVLNNDAENLYYNTAILHLIAPADFIRKLLSTTPENRRTVAYAFKERYSFEQFNSNLLPELGWLTEVASLLREEIAVRAGKVSSLSLQWLVDPYINDAIAQLSKVKPALSE
ncbi:hypothetical protein JWZ98_17740 [Methylomonas sp. EFPC1]|uniref:P-loop NTPase fold protein n=1 Tax=Methylomonas sp. EFPC1 TaxID=2812647 RepID=UPI0019680644|nr:P-loop NTPase fold protein [Methylomonas sp. EFPC1]QSB00496.1 hypothetical protein JWZ98_17740 [Methylomonas sp. EFPC1]